MQEMKITQTMKRQMTLALAAALIMTVQAIAQDDWANIVRYAQANSEITVQPKAVFMGDSITQCWYDVIEEMILKVLK